MTLEAIKEAIVQLPEEERLALESWMAQVWDAHIEKDFSPGGAGMALLDEVDAQIEGVRARHEITVPTAPYGRGSDALSEPRP